MAARKCKERRDPAQGVWFGMGMMGLFGWSVVVPTLLGAALGMDLAAAAEDGDSAQIGLTIDPLRPEPAVGLEEAPADFGDGRPAGLAQPVVAGA